MDIRKLDLNLLLLFDGLYREQNLSAVARRLVMSQPMASANLRHLREYFDDQLFVSTGRGMRPTPFAESIAGLAITRGCGTAAIRRARPGSPCHLRA